GERVCVPGLLTRALSRLLPLKRRNARQVFSFQPFKERAACGGNITERIRKPCAAKCRDDIAPASNANDLSLRGKRRHGLGEAYRCGCKGMNLKRAKRPVPDHGLAAL